MNPSAGLHLWKPYGARSKGCQVATCINKNLLKFKRRALNERAPRLTQTVRENPKAETTAAGRESASAAARVMTSRMVKTSRILQWAIRSEAPSLANVKRL